MSVTDVTQTFQDIQSNWLAGSLVVLYYLILYWPRLKEGFGIGKKVNLDRLEKQYKILQLKEQKQKSSVDNERLKALEKETWLEFESLDKTGKAKKLAFTEGQKFIAIPLLITTLLMAISALIEADTTELSTNILVDAFIFALLIILAFWGIPKLANAKPGTGRTAAFIVFWWFVFYIFFYIFGFILNSLIFPSATEINVFFTSESASAFYFASAFFISLILGFLNKLPKMNQTNNAPDKLE
jgi:hypothetical protein